MAGKGKKRREKNYRAAHGGTDRLPPPPSSSSLDALPSKLRKLMSFAGAVKPSSESAEKKNRGNNKSVVDKAIDSKDVGSKASLPKGESDNRFSKMQHNDHGDKISENNAGEKKKKKRKRNKVNDLRFEGLDGVDGTGSKRKERKKQRLKEMKKKHKKIGPEDMDFPGHEEIKFGEVVEAPPKLVSFPKPSKNIQDASVQRLRLQAVEDYRKRKGWTSRPGILLPPPATSSPMV